MKKFLYLSTLLTLALLLAGSTLHAQRRWVNRRAPTMSFGGQVLAPRGEFASKYFGAPAGIGGNFTGSLGRSPFEIGAGYYWNSMGSTNMDVSIIEGTTSAGTPSYASGTMRLRNSESRYQLVSRFRPFVGKIQPYGEFLGGVSVFKMTSDITVENSGYSSEGAGKKRENIDYAVHYGWALGLRIQLLPGLYGEGRFESLRGTTAEYVDQSSINIVNASTLQFQKVSSKTDQFVFHLGIAMQF
jgi:hypothetical protein